MFDVPVHAAEVTPVRRGVCISVDKKCFVLDAPKNKAPNLVESKARLGYHVQRIKSIAKSARDPDMNMTLNEIRTGVKLSDRMLLSLEVYLIGALLIFMSK